MHCPAVTVTPSRMLTEPAGECEVAGDGLTATLGRTGGAVEQQYRVASRRCHMGDAASHRSGSDDGHDRILRQGFGPGSH